MPRKPKERAGRITFSMPNWNGGVNTSDPAYQLKPNELRLMQDTRVDSSGNAIKRPGYTKVNTSQISNNYVTSAHQFVDTYGNKTAYGICGTKLYSGMDSTVPAEVTDSLGITKTLSSNKRASMLTWKDSLFVGNGNEPAFELGLFDYQLNKCYFTADYTNNIIYKVGFDGKTLDRWGKSGSGVGEFSYIGAIAVDYTNGFVFVLDNTFNGFDNSRIQKFSFSGEFILSKFTNTIGISIPTVETSFCSMDVDTSGNVYLAYDKTPAGAGNETIYIYKLNSNLEMLIDSTQVSTVVTGSKYSRNVFIKVDSTNSRIYVSSGLDDKVYYDDLTFSGGFATSFGSHGTGDGQFTTIRGIWVDETNSLVYVCDNGNNRVQRFNLTGTFDAKYNFTGCSYVWGSPSNNKLFTVQEVANNNVIYTSTLTYGTASAQYILPLASTYVGLGGLQTDRVTTIRTFKDLGAPLSLIATEGAAGTLTGTFKYKITYAIENSGGTLLNESTGGIESNQVTVTSKQIGLTSIPLSQITDVTHRYVYRAYSSDSGVTWGSYYYVGEITNNTVTTYTDNLASATTDLLPTTNTLVAPFKYITMFRDSLYGAGDYNNPNYLYWTDAGDQDAWNIDSYKPIGADDGTAITAINKLSNVVVVFKEHAIYGLASSVSDLTGAVIVSDYVISQEYGSLSHWCVSHATIGGVNGLIFLDPYKGVCFCNGTQAYQLSNKVDSDWATYDKTLLMNATGVYYHKWKEYWFSITTTGSTNNQTWIFNIETKALYKPQTLGLCSLTRMENSSGNEVIYGGSFDGYVYLLDTGVSDNPAGVATAIDSYITTPWHDCGYPSNTKIFDKIIIEYNEQTTGTLTVQWAVDGASFNSTDQSTITLTGTSGKKTKTIIRPYDSTSGRTATGKFISIKLSNNTATDTFEICAVHIEARLKKMFIP